MPWKLPVPNPMRFRSFMFRLPLFTRAIMLVIIVLWVLELQSVWNVVSWGGLVPKEVGLQSMYRLNTYPLIHLGFFHMAFNLLALVPLLERFEAEHGTILSAALFFGPLSTIPAALYLLIEKVLLRSNTAVQGASVWVFLLLGNEAMKTYRASPTFDIGPYKIPTWTTPLILTVIISALIPGVSFLGHLCGLGTGYLYGMGYLKILAPPEKILRWIENKLNLLGRLPHYVSVDQKTYGRYGVLPSSHSTSSGEIPPISMTFRGAGHRVGT